MANLNRKKQTEKSDKDDTVKINQRQIRFFGTKSGKFAIFSNFFTAPMTIGGLEYPTLEHYFQSRKFMETDPEYAETIRNAETPGECKQLGKSREHRIHPHWGGIVGECVWAMKTGLLNKAIQHPEFRNLLISTKNDTIIEASKYDSFWGEGPNGNGKNMMGILLMELREILTLHRTTIFSGTLEKLEN